MTSWSAKVLRLEESALKHLDVIFSHHGVYAITGIVVLAMLLCLWVIVDVSRRTWPSCPLALRREDRKSVV